jgi:glycosyltransferase involved in cell wall biosynthesis
MKIAFCGHSYHRVTQSTVFLRALLQQHGEVIEFWDESWLTGAAIDEAAIIDGGYEVVVVFQMELLALRLARSGLPNLTFFPMYDGCYTMPDSYWRSLDSVKIVSFSSTLHEKLQRLGARCRFVRYWPDPGLFPAARASAPLSGYFWQRQQDVTWGTIRQLLGEQRFDRFTLHKALDPSFGDFVTPSDEDVGRHGIRISEWFDSREQAAADLRQHNIYFAPRLREGIGMSFLEAMAMGFLVVAPDAPTMNEYIVSGVNGLLYDFQNLRPLNFQEHLRLGARARQTVGQGWRKWSRSTSALLRYVLTPTTEHPAQAHFDAFDPWATENQGSAPKARRSIVDAQGSTVPQPRAFDEPRVAPAARVAEEAEQRQGGRRMRSGASQAGTQSEDAPFVTVAVVTRDVEATLRKTLNSILQQDWRDRELVVLDGASRDGTLEVLRDFDDEIDFWRSTPDSGPFDAMNAAAELARGRYIIFMNAGDWFQTTDALTLALEAVEGDPDVIFGHHIYRDVSGRDELHLAADFAQTWSQLQAGAVGWRWLSGVPGHQATLTRTELLRRSPYRNDLRIAADHEFLYRLAKQAGRFHHCASVLSTYVGGGMSWQNQSRCFEEWRRIAGQYTAQPDRTHAAFATMHSELEASALRRRAWPGMLKGIVRGRHALSVLAWRARKRWERMQQARLGRAKIVRVDFGAADLGRHIDLVQGLSAPEGWGRWSDGERVQIDFNDSVRDPSRISLHIRKVYGANVGEVMVIRIGAASYRHRLIGGEQRFCAILDGESRRVPRIELMIPNPSTPRSTGESSDHRRLGIVLSAIEVRLR